MHVYIYVYIAYHLPLTHLLGITVQFNKFYSILFYSVLFYSIINIEWTSVGKIYGRRPSVI